MHRIALELEVPVLQDLLVVEADLAVSLDQQDRLVLPDLVLLVRLVQLDLDS